ncbi:NUDIX hydrolase [Limoniibacter endophyticus]|uniref:DNA mismatch repair protein MutT n=1 Tax=Limoniibacter endophyticus TaxID=1565040 RepID=A0A8J3DHR1_9HYPH|nr:NUDIX domain-containing protein [Limoniibacter endophyticus]GHC68951.1 DNA mismatch repair protein MutT [Limoniibacter endophyticus]
MLIIPAVSAALIRNDTILLVKRGRAPSKGLLAFPGGRVEAGETDLEAVVREIAEETGLVARDLEPHVTLIVAGERPGDAPQQYRLVVFRGFCDEGEAVAADDADDAGWYTLAEMQHLELTGSTLEIATSLLEKVSRA